MNYTYELNNVRKDADVINSNKIRKDSPVVEIFSAMVKGEDVSKFGAAKADKAVKYIKDLGSRAENGDFTAVAELNTIRKFVIETPVMEEIKLLGIFGQYQALGFDENIERDIYTHVGERSREQAANGDVVFSTLTKETYPVGSTTISGGYAVDYRRVALGDMSKENEGLRLVQTDIRNKALLYIVNKVYDAIHSATGVKYDYTNSTLTKTSIDDLINKVRRNGRPTVIGDYALLSQFNQWAGYVGSITPNGGNAVTIPGMSQKALDELLQNGVLSAYNGAILAEMPNPYNEYELTADGTNFKTLLPVGLGFVVPNGVNSPIMTWTRGGLTSFTGNNVKTGKIETRFDLEVACDVAKGQEHRIGTIYDSTLGGLN